MNFHPEYFIRELAHMGIGMLSILAVMGAIILMTVLLNRLTRKK